ncbi:DUF222 domain-containing protein [Actinoplanes sp. NPDC026619]|uniref:HNH endonuclease signature motif containing protein n=1 Tax=Actinoplanes sp. NPDC026619 TaxID=3155798 RepID=UPI0033FCC1BD
MLEELGQVRGVLAECGDAPLWSCSDADLLECLASAWTCAQQLSAITAHLIRAAETRGLPQQDAASSTAVWLRHRLRAGIGEAQRLTQLAAALDRSPALDSAILEGAISAEQATTIATAVADLPDEVGLETTARAESALISFASRFEPIALARLGTRILAHVDPDAADRHGADLLRRREERAHRARGFTLSPFGDGRVRLSGWLDTAAAATVTAALDPLCHPSRDAAVDSGLARTPTQRRADALVDVCARALRTGALPTAGGESAQVVVTIPLDQLQTAPVSADSVPADSVPAESGAAAATVRHSTPPGSARNATSHSGRRSKRHGGAHGRLDNGVLISPADARLLACDAQIIPAVLGTDGQVLDIGRARRLFNGPIRRALNLRDRGCTFPGCDRPATWCEAHHIRSWAAGGPTALSNACLLCRHHHRVIHRTEWEVRLGSDGFPEFIPPATVDPECRPQRNLYHQRE